MTSQDFCLLFEFNSWANARTLQAVKSVPEEQLTVDRKNSFGSIMGTLVHICGAEDIWLQRLNGANPGIFMKQENFPTLAFLESKWNDVESGWQQYLLRLTEEELTRMLTFNTLRGDVVTQKVWESLQHLVNHSTYHRGQITTLIRQSGGTPIGTDLINFYRQKK
jgi:uncharacterized damage-inducible protein DinB